MKLIVGLGNPGRKYEGTRHNVGFEIVELLSARARVVWETAPRGIEGLIARDRTSDVVLVKPLTFMNASGPAVQGLSQFFKIDAADLLVIVDDANLELGRLRARAAGSAGGHNGLKSVIEALGMGEFARLRVGVGRGARRDLGDHVLARFEPEERPIVAEAVGRAADAAELFIREGIAQTMNKFNRKEEKEENDEKDDKEDRE
jgi:PTH1 family peptidyl-tRNA hydrolase